MVDDLKLKMSKLTKYWDGSVLDQPSGSSGLTSLVPVEQTIVRSSIGLTVAQPSGHGVETTTWVDGLRGIPSPIHSPANVTLGTPHPHRSTSFIHEIE